jgi:F-type H+-transporting ATPase subunit gamma
MKKLIHFKENIEGLSDVAETVKTIEKRAASHIHLLKKQVSTLKVYRGECEKILERLSYFYWDSNNPLLKRGSSKKELVVITSDKGIVGGLHHKLIENLLEIKNKYQVISIVGTKGEEFAKEEGIKANIIPIQLGYFPDQEEIRKLSNYFFKVYTKEGREKVDILYPQFISSVEQNPLVIKFLPFSFSDNDFKDKSSDQKGFGLPIFEGEKNNIFDNLLKHYINVFFSEIYIESKLSEFSARTLEAENATQKTKELIENITIKYFKARKRLITQKQLESFSVHKYR